MRLVIVGKLLLFEVGELKGGSGFFWVWSEGYLAGVGIWIEGCMVVLEYEGDIVIIRGFV